MIIDFDYKDKWHMQRSETFRFWEQTDHFISAKRPVLMFVKKKKRICQLVNLVVPVGHRVEVKESQKLQKYFDFARYLKKLWNIKAIVNSQSPNDKPKEPGKKTGLTGDL